MLQWAVLLRSWRGADGALEGPATDVIDLLIHGARERNNAHRDADEILLGHVAVGQPRAGQGRYYALLDFGSGPAGGELLQLIQIEAGRIHAAAVEVNLED